MNINYLFVVFLGLALVSCSSETSPEEEPEVEGFSADFQPMQDAYVKARSTVDVFIAALEKKENSDYRYLVKAPVEADDMVEHVWLEPVTFKDGVFTGAIANEFADITSVLIGDEWSVPQDEISDWAIMDESDNMVEGGYTIKVMESYRGERVR